jgi:sec-independent protein translocase protein TatA
MGIGSWWHWLIVLAVVLLLFGGGGKIPKLMKDLGQGITQFKRGLKEEDKAKAEVDASGKVIEHQESTVASATQKDKVAS